MSAIAIVCGGKRSYDYYFNEDVPSSPLTKRHRCGSGGFSPSRSPPPPPPPLLHLKSLFPHLNPQLLEKALEECGNDLESTIKNLNDHFVDQNLRGFSYEPGSVTQQHGTLPSNEGGVAAASENTTLPNNLPAYGAEWVDMFVREMMNATNMDDAKGRASRVLETLEKSIRIVAAEETAQTFHKENTVLKEHNESLIRENTILKRAVAIQHERFEDKSRELQQLKELMSQYQEKLKTLEVNNYALMMHLRQAGQSNPIPGRFNPDVF